MFDAELSSRPESRSARRLDSRRRAPQGLRLPSAAPLDRSATSRSLPADHHIAIVGIITPDELRSLIDEMSIANGLGNRFLYVWSRMSAWLPYGGEIDPVAPSAIVDQIDSALATLDGHIAINGSVHFPLAPAARERWGDFYRRRRTGIGEGITRVTQRPPRRARRAAQL